MPEIVNSKWTAHLDCHGSLPSPGTSVSEGEYASRGRRVSKFVLYAAKPKSIPCTTQAEFPRWARRFLLLSVVPPRPRRRQSLNTEAAEILRALCVEPRKARRSRRTSLWP
jgi:hypothetical protein